MKEKILEIIKLLDELDEFENSISENLSYFDSKISDLYHKLENMKLNFKTSYEFCKELREVLIERRNYKYNMRIYQEFSNQKQKLINGIDNRKMLLNSIIQKDKNIHQPYKNRIYSEDELKEKIGV